MSRKNERWTDNEIEKLIELAEFDSMNMCVNSTELSKKMQRTVKAVDYKIYELRKKGTLKEIDRTNYFDPYGRYYSQEEKERIIWMHKKGYTIMQISIELDRTHGAIVSYMNRLHESGEHEPNLKRWTEEDDLIIINNITFDEHGYVNNYPYLMKLTNRSYKAIICRLVRLRKKGKIKTKSNGKGSIAGNKAIKELRERFYNETFGWKEKRKNEIL